MPITHFIPTDTTEVQGFQALIDDVATDLTGGTLELDVHDRFGQNVTVTGAVAFTDATLGKWGYTPDGQLVTHLSPYSVRLKLTLSGVAKFPNGELPDTWIIVR
jgi:hypothetical protein